MIFPSILNRTGIKVTGDLVIYFLPCAACGNLFYDGFFRRENKMSLLIEACIISSKGQPCMKYTLEIF
jgi:hypothetical protein